MQKQKKTPPMKASEPSVLAQVANLSNLSLKELNDMWLRLNGAPAPAGQKRPFLQSHLAYRIQELAYAQVNPALIASNKTRVDNMIEHLKPLAKARSKKEVFKLVPGTRLRRDFQGKTHEVTVLSDGNFEYEGRPFTSLTAVAHEITQLKWSGPSFFGLSRSNPAVVGGRR
jgi:Protein of unknown function (DUF2924)